MSAIDQVIARARQPGSFSEHKRFRIARKRAIGKLRRFALADPHFYILELIQAAVANSATCIDARIGPKDCTFAWVGGGLAEADLANLFDFLFASKDRVELGHLRELALGINASLLFGPDNVLVESGNGTLEGTTRLVLHEGAEAVEIGRPDRPLYGTYVTLRGMKRGKLPDGFARWAGAETQREVQVIEERCLTAPVPIIVNDVPVFGLSSQRTPGLFGYKAALSFDEGDMYGTLGHSPSFGSPSVQLLTWGVAIQSKVAPAPLDKIGGIVCFDRLHKTVDHAGIVEDDRLEELWARLQPYAEQLVGGKHKRNAFTMSRLDGRPLDAAELRSAVYGKAVVVLVPVTTPQDPAASPRAAAIGRHLDAPVLCGEARFAPTLRALSGGALRIVAPDVDDDTAVLFYAQPEADPPARPWLTPPVDVAPLPAWKVVARLFGAEPGQERDPSAEHAEIVAALGGAAEIHATVFTPEAHVGSGDEQLLVQVRTSHRILWEGSVASTYAGHVLVVELPDADPNRLLHPIDAQPEAPALVVETARLMATHAAAALGQAFRRAVAALADLPIAPGSPAATLGLSAAARVVVPRLALLHGEPAVAFSQLEVPEVDLLALPLLRRLDGEPVDLRTLARWMNEGHGLVYAAVHGTVAALDDLDRSRILSVTPAEERWLVMLVGESTYVRIDARDVLASHEGVVCRDLALGLRAYPDFPLLVEGEEDPSTWTPEERRACERALVAQLVRRLAGEEPKEPREPAARADWEECRRHALRLLQWYACRSIHATHRAAAPEVYDLALFLDAQGRPCSLRQASAALQREQGLALYYGHAYGSAELGHLAAAAAGRLRPDPTVTLETVVAPPFLYRLLWSLGRARPAFDLVLERTAVRDPTGIDPEDTTRESGPLVVCVDIDAPGARGVIAITRAPIAHPEIVLLLPDRDRACVFSELALEHGCVGWVQLDAGFEWNDEQIDMLAGRVRAACETALQRLVGMLHEQVDPQARSRFVALLLGYARRHLTLTATGDAAARPVVNGVLVDRVLSLPLFPSRYGGAISAWRLVRRFCALFGESAVDASRNLLRELPDRLAPELSAWIAWTLIEGNVLRQRSVAPASDLARFDASRPVDAYSLQATLNHWIRRLCPDRPAIPLSIVVASYEQDGLADCFANGAVHVDTGHWLVRWATAEGARDPKVLAWLLLAVYAQINAALEEVTNDHERAFQCQLADALASDELCMLQARAPIPPPAWPAPLVD